MLQAYDIARGLQYLHDSGLAHGNLHPGNILVDNDGHARITDFGLSVIYSATPGAYGSSSKAGVYHYAAPEILDPEEGGSDRGRPTPESDVFSFACVVVQVGHSMGC